ncbi:MAG: PQQ-dependent sugar dehydrogenase, partial [Halobacteriales archaeon]|nr:PQQ-dependent sugar dehydrogenase [Halobacteriales archaeon]
PLDGMLYFGLGDGGAGGDPFGNGQNPNTLLGKMLRLDVNGAHGYAIPPTNPCAATLACRPEIWSMGLRNPWRWSFDAVTGDLWIGDVGQNAWEEVDWQPALLALPVPLNYGWNCWEGNHMYAGCNGIGPSQGALTFPVVEYSHAQGCSIIGGFAYRGTAIPALHGAYLYGDLCSQRVWGAFGAGRARVPSLLMNSGQTITSFGQDEQHELYLVGYGGGVFKLVPA